MEDLIPVRKLLFEANADFAVDALRKEGIDCEVEEINENGKRVFEIKVQSAQEARAMQELARLDLDETPVDKESEGFIEGLNEWTTNMYNPGYYTGGRIPPFYLNKANWKIFISYFALMGATYILLSGFFAGGIFLLLAISMWLQIRNKKNK